jgi:hypothetical protein
METRAFPRKPYDEVESAFLREELHRGSFDDLEHRRYVNELVWLEWYATRQTGSSTPGALGTVVTNWRLAAGHPEVFDIVRREVGASTRDSLDLRGGLACNEEADLDERARELKRAWRAV